MEKIEIICMIIILIVVFAAACVLAYRGNKSVVMKMLVALVTEAEREYGGGTGSLKLASVVAVIYPKLPAIIKACINEATLSRWVEEALKIAKESWEKNNKIAKYIVATGEDEQKIIMPIADKYEGAKT